MKKTESEEMEVTISSWTVVRTVLILGLVGLIWFLRDIFLVVLTAIVFAAAIEPGVQFFMKRKIFGRNIPRLPSVMAIFILGALLLALVFYFFVPAVLDDMSRLTHLAPKILNGTGLWDPLSGGVVGDGVAKKVESLSAVTGGSSPTAIIDDVQNVLSIFKNEVESGGAVKGASVFFGGLLSFILIVVLSFYLSAQERGVENFLRLVSPAKSRVYVVDLWHRSQIKIGQWFQGQLMLCVAVAAVAAPGLLVLGVNSALFLALLMAVFELIPVFGPIMASVPAILIAYTEGIHYFGPGINAALVIGIFYFFLQQVESHVLYPLVIRKIIGIPPVLVILALVIGAKVAGFLGIILSVPVTAILMEFLNDIARERKIFEDKTS